MQKKRPIELAKNIKLVVFDVDGVLTDGRLFLGENDNEYKCFHVRDGHGIVMLLEAGFDIAIITARSSHIVSRRMHLLGIRYVFQGEKNKGKRLAALMRQLNLDRMQVAYVGDDVIDLPAMIKTGLPIAVADAHLEVIKHAAWVTQNKGGEGAVREVCECIMEAQGQLRKKYDSYLL